MKCAGDGAFADINLDTIRMSMDTTSFKNIESSATNSYGVINARSLSSLVLNSITATGLKN